MAADDEISMDAAMGAAFSEPDDIDILKEEHTNSTAFFW